MKKFIAPEVRVVRYDSSILCLSFGDDIEPGSGEVEADAPGRHRSIFDNSDTDLNTRTSGRR